ncbi:MAG: hypothetical protein AAB897_03025 [Patescibacteria group bacterium]
MTKEKMNPLEQGKETIMRRAEGKEAKVLAELEKLKQEFGGVYSKNDLFRLKAAMDEFFARKFPPGSERPGPTIFEEIKRNLELGLLTEEEYEEYMKTYFEALPRDKRETIQ